MAEYIEREKVIEKLNNIATDYIKDNSMWRLTLMMEKCKKCGKTPSIADVGGNNPYYEIVCCGQVVGSHDRESAIYGWNAMQKGELSNDT